MIRVLQIVPTLGYGGVAQFLLNYYRLMPKSDIKFDFVTHGGVEDFHAQLIEEGSTIYYVKPISQSGIITYIQTLGKIVSSGHYDIIHTHDGHMTGITSMICRLHFRGPIIAHAHTTLCPNPKHRPFMPIFRLMSRIWASKLLACGKEAGKYLFGKSAKFTVIHNAVPIERFQNIERANIEILREKYKINANELVIGHVGLFTTPKNHVFIIKMFSKLLEKRPNARLILVGGGNDMEKIIRLTQEKGIGSKVIFAGKQSDIPSYMNLFDVFILPSLFEGLPVVAVEAQASGLPCLLSNKIDHDVDAGLGLVSFLPIEDSNISDWVSKLTHIERQKVEHEEIIRAFQKQGYDIATSVDSLLKTYYITLNDA